MPHIAIIGAGQSGLQLALSLLAAGHQVTLCSNRTADDSAAGKVMSSQCMFHTALQVERDLGLDFWGRDCPPVEGIALAAPHPEQRGAKAIDWAARLNAVAQSVDQRLKVPAWKAEFQKRGGLLALTTTGPCEIMVFEGVPGGPVDCWADAKTPVQHLARSRKILQDFLPWEADRCATSNSPTTTASWPAASRPPCASRWPRCRRAARRWAWPRWWC